MADTKIEIEREYYSIKEASLMLGCSVLDLVHLGVNKKLSLFILLNNKTLSVSLSKYESQEVPFLLYGQYDWLHNGLAAIHAVDLAPMESEDSRPSVLTRVSSLREVPIFVTEYIQKVTDGLIAEFFITYVLLEDLSFNRDNLIVTIEDIKKLKANYVSNEMDSGKNIGERERNNLYRIIAALSDTLLKENAKDGSKPHLKNQSALIEYLVSEFDGYEGLSKSNLEKIMPIAKKLIP